MFSLLFAGIDTAGIRRKLLSPLLVSSNLAVLDKLFSGTEFLGKLGDLSSGNIRLVWGKVQLEKWCLWECSFVFFTGITCVVFPLHMKEGFMVKTMNLSSFPWLLVRLFRPLRSLILIYLFSITKVEYGVNYNQALSLLVLFHLWNRVSNSPYPPTWYLSLSFRLWFLQVKDCTKCKLGPPVVFVSIYLLSLDGFSSLVAGSSDFFSVLAYSCLEKVAGSGLEHGYSPLISSCQYLCYNGVQLNWTSPASPEQISCRAAALLSQQSHFWSCVFWCSAL